MIRQLLALVMASAMFCAFSANAASPNISLKGLDQKYHHLSEYIGQGKWVVLNVWGPSCPPCVDEIPELVSFHDEHKDKDAIVVGVAIDFPSFEYAKEDEVRQFVEDYFVSFPILLADAKTVARFGAGRLQGTPSSFVFDPDGELAAMQVGTVSQMLIEEFMATYKPRKPQASKSKNR